MPYALEPEHRHGRASRTGVLLVNLGTPEAPTAPAVRRYLAQFLSDPRVVEIPAALWKPILHGIILRVRPAKSAAKYASVWMPEGSPLAVWTRRQAEALQRRTEAAGERLTVRHAMRYGQPAIASELDALKAEGCERILVVPMYPQYSGTTTASVMDDVHRWQLTQRALPEIRWVRQHHDEPAYIDALAARVRDHWAREGRGDHLLLSFHGVPERTLHLGDPYHCQCYKTQRLLAERLGLTADQISLSFQSRFGKAKWLEPYTEPTLQALAKRGVRHLQVFCPGFAADCLETLEEIAIEGSQVFLQAGGQRFDHIACLNDHPAWIDALHAIVQRHGAGWPILAEERPGASDLEAQRLRALAVGAKQ
ncbi:MAG: protoporphyrin/coproporphyrin ferrochelatase [Pseudomonadota bacterium]|nr:protoporphyrin/coproporphyrin ferrochelatase [Pseudomonadota bacterium]